MDDYVHKKLSIKIRNKTMIEQSLRYVKMKLRDMFGDEVIMDVTSPPGTHETYFVIIVTIPLENFLRLKLIKGDDYSWIFINEILFNNINPRIMSNIFAYWE